MYVKLSKLVSQFPAVASNTSAAYYLNTVGDVEGKVRLHLNGSGKIERLEVECPEADIFAILDVSDAGKTRENLM